jgi:hypothetical protein
MVNLLTFGMIPGSLRARLARKVISDRGETLFTRVSELIYPITSQWDLQLLNDIFCAVDVGRILEIPINNQNFEDFVALAVF